MTPLTNEQKEFLCDFLIENFSNELQQDNLEKIAQEIYKDTDSFGLDYREYQDILRILSEIQPDFFPNRTTELLPGMAKNCLNGAKDLHIGKNVKSIPVIYDFDRYITTFDGADTLENIYFDMTKDEFVKLFATTGLDPTISNMAKVFSRTGRGENYKRFSVYVDGKLLIV